MSYENVPWWRRETPDNLKTQEMCDEAVRREPYTLQHVPYYLKMQEMCDEAVHMKR